MNRPWQVWSIFGACSLVVAAATTWLTVHALQADRARAEARAAAELEENVNNALWRMDTILAPLIAEEIARPHFYYESFIVLGSEEGQQAATAPAVPSPLLTGPETNVLLNFDVTSDGRWRSPQAPPQQWVEMACSNGLTIEDIADNQGKLKQLSELVDVSKLISQLPDKPLPRLHEAAGINLEGLQANQSASTRGLGTNLFYNNRSTPPETSDGVDFLPLSPKQSLDAARPDADGESQVAQAEPSGFGRGGFGSEPAGGAGDREANAYGGGRGGYGELAGGRGYGEEANAAARGQSFAGYGGRAKTVAEFEGRDQRVQQATQREMLQQRKGNFIVPMQQQQRQSSPVIENVSRPLWVENELLLARRVVREGETVVQGSWLDWPSLKLQLLGEVADILPEADLQPVRAEDAEDPSRDLASLPVRLVVNRSPASATSASSALRWSLSVIWAALAVALLAAAALLGGVLALSERRAAFVSSVTHELRTPLTTFRMYADMLARDMVPTATRRKEYMETLRREAERLTNLVENVLSYARLERGRKPQRNDRTTIGAMLERFESRLYDRAEQADMQLVLQIDDDATRANVLTDAGVVEQILFNLVDNAAKYAGRASDRRIHVEALRSSDYVEITVRDHGPGFADPRDAERAKAFQKSAQQAAETAPGVGLGLALCRRLAGEVGGRLKAGSSNSGEPGARVTLGLPVER